MSGALPTPFASASSATANRRRTSCAKSLRAASSAARRARICAGWSSAINAMSSADNSTGPAFLALTCQKIKLAENTIATAAAIRAFLVEVKILSFLTLSMLHQFEQHSIKRRWMNKGYQTPTCTHARRFVNQPRSFVFQFNKRGLDVSNLDCDMVHSRSAFSEKLSYRRFGSERLKQLHVSVAHSQHTNLDALLGNLFGRIHFQAKRIPPDCETFFDAVCGQADVIDLHVFLRTWTKSVPGAAATGSVNIKCVLNVTGSLPLPVLSSGSV